MRKLCIFLAVTIFSYSGWFLGMKINISVAFGLSFLGSIVGVVTGWWINQRFFE